MKILHNKLSFLWRLLLLVSISSVGTSFGQKVVKELPEKGKNGKLYFSEKDNKLSILVDGKYYGLFQAPKDTSKPVPPPPVHKETVAGYWSSTDRVLVAYNIGGGLWLMQRDPEGTYYVARGRNLIDDPMTDSNGLFRKQDLSGDDTSLGGLYAPSDFPEFQFLQETGRVKNAQGEYVKQGGGGDTDKIKIPVGVICWSGWFTTLVPDNPIDITKETRYALSLPQTVNQIPFYGQYTPTEVINKHNWNDQTKQWEWSQVSVNVKFDGDRAGVAEAQVVYAASAGIDYFLFNYYTKETPMSLARLNFEALKDKKGVKSAYILENVGGDIYSEAKTIVHNMRQEWYQKIDGKPIVVFPAAGSWDYDRVANILSAIKAEYGGEIYSVLQVMGYPVEVAGEVRKRGYSSHSRYSTWGGWNEGDRTHKFIMDAEIDWYKKSLLESVGFTPNLTTSFYQYGAQASWGGNPENYSEKATDDEVREQWSRLAKLCKDNPSIKTVYAYSWDEFSEGGRTICPQLRKDGSIDDSTLKIISNYVE